jgi:hypothetical protein
MTWAQRLKRVFAINIEVCRRCGGRLKVIASIEEPTVIEKILEYLGRADGVASLASQHHFRTTIGASASLSNHIEFAIVPSMRLNKHLHYVIASA